MTAPAHLTDEQTAGYRERTLSAADLLDVDEHIGACQSCRDRLYIQAGASAAIRMLRSELAGHLRYDEIVACSEGDGKPGQLAHIRECPSCQADVQDLSRFRTELVETRRRPPPSPVKAWLVRRRIPLGIGAAALVLALAAIAMLPKRSSPDTLAESPREQADPKLPAAERALLQQALDTGRMERAPILDRLIARRGKPAEPGKKAAEPPFNLVAPIGTTVLSDRPLMRWAAMTQASSYVVTILDEQSQKLAESPELTVPEWRPAQPLPREKVLSWKVTARTPSGNIVAPGPPAPEARFLIVAPHTVEQIEAVRRDFPGNPLLMAVLYARAGALDDATDVLRAIEPYRAQRYLEYLAKLRLPE